MTRVSKMFIAVDGVDGSGKTTLVEQLLVHLADKNPLRTKEPTDRSKWGQRLRSAATEGRLPRELELEYFRRDRIFHIRDVIQPALNAGRWVITDRYFDSTLAFQAVSPEEADNLFDAMVSEVIMPDISFIIDCPYQIGLERIRRDRGVLSAYERDETLRRAEKIYASRKGDNYIHLDGSGSAEYTYQQAIAGMTERLSKLGQSCREVTKQCSTAFHRLPSAE